MTTLPPQSFRQLADRLASAALSPAGQDLMQLLLLSGILDGRNSSQPAAQSAPQGDGSITRVGIWERTSAGGESRFTRAADTAAEWHLWANISAIEPKRSRYRVVLLGESVARGWLYQPHYTPARVLQVLLQSCLGRDVEVVDLARTDLCKELRELAISAAALEPDAVVVFSGNNWRPSTPEGGAALSEFDAALRTNGVCGLKKMLEEQLYADATRIVRDVSTHYRARQIPVVWVVPEFNLVDWHDWKMNAPHLPSNANAAWMECAEAAAEALASENYALADSLATTMSELDGGTGSYALGILANCARRRGELSNARRLLEAARDARIWDFSHPLCPRPFAATQNAIRAAARAAECPVVDLPKVFAAHCSDELPDRRLFIDYCHLTDEGIRVSMSAVAAQLASARSGKPIEPSSLLARAPEAERKVKAEALFLAAIHNAHWWQPQEIVLHHCSAALRESDHVRTIMRIFLDLQTTPAPMLLGRAAEQLTTLVSPSTQRYILRNSAALLDEVLLTSITQALATIGVNVVDHLQTKWKTEHSAARRPRDLLSFYYLSSSGQPQELAWALPSEFNDQPFFSADYYKAYWRESRFVFVAERQRPLRLRLTYRIPSEASSEALVYVNGALLGSVKATSEWSTQELMILGDAVLDGVNSVLIRWPPNPDSGKEKLLYATRALMCGAKDCLFAVFGEIHRVVVQPA